MKIYQRNAIFTVGCTFSILMISAFTVNPILSGYAHADTTVSEIDESIEVIEVTARRKKESLLEIPLSVSVFDGDSIGTGQFNSLEDLAEATPNVVFNPQAGPITIRGVGSLGINGGLERQMGVGILLDEVYIRRPISFPIFLDDLERAEIIRGSQSALYGENTVGGAINLLARKPGDTRGSDIELSVGNLDYRRVRAGIDVPLADNVNTRTFLTYTKRDGYIQNKTQGVSQGTIDNIGGRFIAESQLSSATDFLIIADYDRTDDDAGLPFVPIDLAFDGRSENDFPSQREIDRGGIMARIDHDFGELVLTSITAYREYDYLALLDGDFTSSAFLFQGQEEDQNQFSQEFRLTSETGQSPSWRLGAYYLHEDFEGAQSFDFLGLAPGTESRNTLEQTADVSAVYGELSWQVNASIEATFGLRYTREKRDGNAAITSGSGNFFLGSAASVDGSETFDDVLPEASIAYQTSDSTTLYARIAKGFKAGGISQFVDENDTANVFKPEKSWTYEVGAKSLFASGKIGLNVAAFAIDWTDQQVRISITPTVRVIRNAASSSSKGAEVEVFYKPTENLRLNLGYGYLDAEYDEFKVPFINADFSGIEQQYAPQNSVSAGFAFDREIDNELRVFASGSWSHRSSYRFEPASDFRQPTTNIIDIELGIKYLDYAFSLWGKNITDEAFLKGFVDFGPNGFFGVPAEDTTWGASVRATF
ncbi:MAG: TonB-dependent receptor [Pseudomonadota bacterium]